MKVGLLSKIGAFPESEGRIRKVVEKLEGVEAKGYGLIGKAEQAFKKLNFDDEHESLLLNRVNEVDETLFSRDDARTSKLGYLVWEMGD